VTTDRRGTRPRGFTLIELLTVIAIIAILAGILIPVLSKAKSRGLRIACIHNLTQMGAALRMYLNDWNGTMMFRQGAQAWSTDTGWTARLKAYNDTVDLFHCPADTHYFSYGMNYWAMSRAAPPAGPAGDPNKPFRESQVLSPTKMIIIYECPGSGVRNPGGGGDVESGDSDIDHDGQLDGHVYGQTSQQTKAEAPDWKSYSITNPGLVKYAFHRLHFPGRHDGGNNLLFFDGHAKWFQDWDDHQMTYDPSKRPL
jgi:prepilin-type N-terminal cleavage/methylation domain-containing protein/prepilin-type processing-associated H-X9-DG protein